MKHLLVAVLAMLAVTVQSSALTNLITGEITPGTIIPGWPSAQSKTIGFYGNQHRFQLYGLCDQLAQSHCAAPNHQRRPRPGRIGRYMQGVWASMAYL